MIQIRNVPEALHRRLAAVESNLAAADADPKTFATVTRLDLSRYGARKAGAQDNWQRPVDTRDAAERCCDLVG